VHEELVQVRKFDGCRHSNIEGDEANGHVLQRYLYVRTRSNESAGRHSPILIMYLYIQSHSVVSPPSNLPINLQQANLPKAHGVHLFLASPVDVPPSKRKSLVCGVCSPFMAGNLDLRCWV
jgi:hypothetical protein